MPTVTGPRTTFLALITSPRCNFKIWHPGPQNRTWQFHHRIHESLKLNCIPTNALSANVGKPQKRFRGCRHPFIIRNMVLTDAFHNNVVIVAGKPVSIVGLGKTWCTWSASRSRRTFCEILAPQPLAHTFVSCLQADIYQMGVSSTQRKCLYLSVLHLNVIIP